METIRSFLRRGLDIPANQAMDLYFQKTENGGFRGGRSKTLSITLNEDLTALGTTAKHLLDHN